MDQMSIWALLWGINIFTPCRERATFVHLEYLITTIIKRSEEHFSSAQVERIICAMKLSAQWHAGIYRLDGTTPYIMHPLEVVIILMNRGVYDLKLIIATILHDVVEDAKDKNKRYRYRQTILLEFRSTVRAVVELVTKGQKPWEKEQFFTFLHSERRLKVSWRAKLLKLGDCLANAQTFDIFEKEKRKKKIAEVLRNYPQLADSLNHDLRKLVKIRILPAFPYEHLAENLMQEIRDALGHHL
jgi:(p)ppGpp synthase/HD superfamily hydrolase